MAQGLENRCPACRGPILRRLREGETYTCPRCERPYHVIVDDSTGRLVLLDQRAAEEVEPLGLPKGSIRALVSLLLAGACWLLAWRGAPIPQALQGVMLAVIAYYFGYRSRGRSGGGKLLDPADRRREPLGLPPGVIRMVLIGGFATMAAALAVQGRLAAGREATFLLMLLALIVGHLFARVLGRVKGSRQHAWAAHLLGLAVLLCGGALAALFALEEHTRLPPGVVAGLCGVVGFYLGSRS